MAIKRGVSFYSYQQEQFFGRMDYHDMAKEMHDNFRGSFVIICEYISRKRGFCDYTHSRAFCWRRGFPPWSGWLP